jgi:cytochrome P450
VVVDLEWVSEHFNPTDPRLAGEGPLLGDGLTQAVDLMLEHCPVTHSDGQWFGSPYGTWVVNRYEDARAVIGDPELFSSRVQKGAKVEPAQIPIDVDPPLLVDYRRFLLPHLSLKAVAKFEPAAREIVTKLIDGFIESGRCDDAVFDLAYPFSSQVQWGWLVGVDDIDHEKSLGWVLTWVHKHFEPEFVTSTQEWYDWIDATIASRRAAPRRDDLIDSLLYGELQSRPLNDDEISRIMMIMILGGVTAVADAVSNVLLRLAADPALQQQLRDDPSQIPRALEEFFRLEPSATGVSRVATRDTEIDGHEIKAGEHVFIHIAAANQDPAEFECPHAVKLDRERNAHLSFGAGHHRCLGSNFARQNIRVVFEEVLSRMHDIRLIDGDPPERKAGLGWMLERLPITFTPGPKVLS